MEYYTVRNWRRFQHYKHRSPPWIKLHFEMLTSADWVMLDDASKLLAIACMLLASRNEGRVPADPSYIKRVAYIQGVIKFKPLIDSGFLENPLALASESKQLRTNALPETETETETETEKKEVDSRASQTKRARARARIPLPENFSLSEKGKAHAQGRGFAEGQITSIAEQFENHHRAKGNLMADWEAAWRTWVNNEIKFQRNTNGGGNGKAIKRSPIIEHVEKRIRQFENLERGGEPLGGGLARLLPDRRS
jgi:hypothetical protein